MNAIQHQSYYMFAPRTLVGYGCKILVL